jgi:hypothetical protein
MESSFKAVRRPESNRVPCNDIGLLDGETMTDVCRDFGISRKTGYKIFDRYKENGLDLHAHTRLTLLGIGEARNQSQKRSGSCCGNTRAVRSGLW